MNVEVPPGGCLYLRPVAAAGALVCSIRPAMLDCCPEDFIALTVLVFSGPGAKIFEVFWFWFPLFTGAAPGPSS